jgi:hypothetical protein
VCLETQFNECDKSEISERANLDVYIGRSVMSTNFKFPNLRTDIWQCKITRDPYEYTIDNEIVNNNKKYGYVNNTTASVV